MQDIYSISYRFQKSQAKTSHGRPSGKRRPFLRLAGEVLEQIGLEVGSKVHVVRDGNRLIIEPVTAE